MRQRRWLAVQVVGTVVLLGVAVRALDFGAIADTLLDAHPGLAVGGWVLLLAGQLVSALRWRELAARRGVPGSPGWFGRVYLRGCFYNALLPTGLGGDAVRVALLRGVTSTGAATRSVVSDRLLGFAALAVTAGVAIPFTAYLDAGPLQTVIFVGAGAVAIGVGALVASGRIPAWIARTAGWTLAYEAIWFAGVWCLAAAVGVSIAPAALPVVMLVVGVALALPLSVGGTGAREGAFVLALTPLGIAAGPAVALGVEFGLALALVGVVGAVVRVDRPAPERVAGSPASLSPEVTSWAR